MDDRSLVTSIVLCQHEGRVHSLIYVFIHKDGIEDPLDAGPVLEDPHGPRPPAHFPEDPFYGIGRPYLPPEGWISKTEEGEQVVEIVPQAFDRLRVAVHPRPGPPL